MEQRWFQKNVTSNQRSALGTHPTQQHKGAWKRPLHETQRNEMLSALSLTSAVYRRLRSCHISSLFCVLGGQLMCRDSSLFITENIVSIKTILIIDASYVLKMVSHWRPRVETDRELLSHVQRTNMENIHSSPGTGTRFSGYCHYVQCVKLGPQGCETSRLPHFLDNWLTDGCEDVSLTRRPPFTPAGRFLEIISVSG
jgi:hypothetical protein